MQWRSEYSGKVFTEFTVWIRLSLYGSVYSLYEKKVPHLVYCRFMRLSRIRSAHEGCFLFFMLSDMLGYLCISSAMDSYLETTLTSTRLSLLEKKKAHSPLKVKYGQSTDGDVISATWRQEQLTLSAFQNHSWELRVVHKCLESSHPCICASRVLSLHNWMTPW